MQDDPQPLTDDELAAIEPDDVEIRLAKSQVFSVRLSATELRLIAEEAGKVGLTTGAFIKQAALDAAETERYSAPPEMSVAITGTGFAILSNPGVESHPTVDAPGDRVVSPSPATEVA